GAAETLILPGSKVGPSNSTRLTDGGSNALRKHSHGSGVDGRYIFPLRGGHPLSTDLIERDTNLPDPGLEVHDTHRSVAVGSTIAPAAQTESTGARRLISRTPATCTVVDGEVSTTAPGK